MVAVDSAQAAQLALEAKLEERRRQVQSGAITRQQAFGNIAEWRLDVGRHQLLLVPFNGEWLHHDRLHDTWENTGYYAGQVIFVAKEHILGVRYRQAPAALPPTPSVPATPAAVKNLCVQCGAELITGAKFCMQCGTPAGASAPAGKAVYCIHCGAAIEPGTKFCIACGRAL